MARGESKRERDRRERKRSNQGAQSELVATAYHEAAHAVAAHAVGRRVVYLRITPVTLPVGHPQNTADVPVVSLGFQLSEPLMAAEVNARHTSGEPFTGAETEWLLQETVISLAGPVMESPDGTPGATMADDFRAFGQIAGMLGRTDERDGVKVVEPEFLRRVERATRQVVSELLEHVIALSKALLETPEMDEKTAQAALAAIPAGSHRHLLDELLTAP